MTVTMSGSEERSVTAAGRRRRFDASAPAAPGAVVATATPPAAADGEETTIALDDSSPSPDRRRAAHQESRREYYDVLEMASRRLRAAPDAASSGDEAVLRRKKKKKKKAKRRESRRKQMMSLSSSSSDDDYDADQSRRSSVFQTLFPPAMMERGVSEKFISSFSARDLVSGERRGGGRDRDRGRDPDPDDPNDDLPPRWNPASLVAAARSRQSNGRLDAQGFYAHARGRAGAAYGKVQALAGAGPRPPRDDVPSDVNLHSTGKAPRRQRKPALTKHESIVWGDESLASVSSAEVDAEDSAGDEEDKGQGVGGSVATAEGDAGGAEHAEADDLSSSSSDVAAAYADGAQLAEASDTYLENSHRVERRMWRRERRRLGIVLAAALAFLFLCTGLFASRRRAAGRGATPPPRSELDPASGPRLEDDGRRAPPPRPLPAAPVTLPAGLDDSASPGDPGVPIMSLHDLRYIVNGITPDAAILNDPQTPQSKALAWSQADIVLYDAGGAARVAQRYALVTLLYATHGSGWRTSTNWGQDHECEWYGVSCKKGEDNVSYVTYLDLNSNNLAGTIPEEIGYITSLEQIFLWGNNLVGSIPGSLSRLEQLQTLYLDGNRLEGEVGSTFNRLKNLRHLDLSGNRLRGHVPHGLGALTNLRDLRLSSNFLTSTLPSSLISLSNLATLLLDSNALSGSLPSLIGEMRSLVILRIHENDMNGRLPSFADAERLEELHLDGNYFSGPIPHFSSSHLRELYLSRNALTGSIPFEIGNLTKLETFIAAHNRLSSSIPGSISRLSELQILDLSHNTLSGLVPHELSSLAQMQELRLEHNHLQGGFPDFLGSMTPLEVVRLNNNLFNGEVGLSLDVGDLNDLTEFSIENNDLRGAVGEFICDLLLDVLTADCWGSPPMVDCPCCTECY